ncbi:MAG: hypothetical protein EHM59_17320 [Betaproteobacteria bacterium]|nr:MAG: hypothetical protein EHM59_17320 [Betaproteobacteria bacterium]
MVARHEHGYAIDRLGERFLRGTYDPPNFALGLGHKDMALAIELGRELGVAMRLANLAHAEMTEALNRGWHGRDARSYLLLQQERGGARYPCAGGRHRGGAEAGRLSAVCTAAVQRNILRAASSSEIAGR